MAKGHRTAAWRPPLPLCFHSEPSLLSEVYLLSSRLHFLKSDGKVTRVGVGSLDWSGSWHFPLFSLWPPGVTYSRSESLSPCSLTGVWGGWTNTCKMLCPARKLGTSRCVVGLVACSCSICGSSLLTGYPLLSKNEPRTVGLVPGRISSALRGRCTLFFKCVHVWFILLLSGQGKLKIHKGGSFYPLLYPKLLKQWLSCNRYSQMFVESINTPAW